MLSKALILDRDGVINVDTGYVAARDRFVFTLGIFPFLREVQDRGYRLAIATNQGGVALGYYTVEAYQALTDFMLDSFRREGIQVDLVLACFDHRDRKIEGYRRESFWRKPNPGMLLEIIQRLRLDPARSAFIGDNIRDMQAGQAGGIGKCLWLTGEPVESSPGVIPVSDWSQTLAALDRPGSASGTCR